MYFATGGGGSGVRVPDVPFDVTNIFQMMLWVVMTFAPIAELLVDFIFTTWTDGLFGQAYSLAQILVNPVTLGGIWIVHSVRSLVS